MVDRQETGAGATAQADLALVVVAYQSEQWLVRCIRSLAENAVFCSLVDNSGISESLKDQLEACHPNLRIEPFQGNLGFVRGINFAVTKLRKRSFAILGLVNPDTWFEPGWADGVRRAFAQYPDFGILAPLQFTYEDGATLAGWSKIALGVSCVADLVGKPVPIAVPLVEGSALFVRKEIVDDLGVHSPVFDMYYGDYDLCRRVRRAGWKIGVVPSIRYHHAVSASSGGSTSPVRRLRLDLGRILYLATDPTCSQARNAIEVVRFFYHTGKAWLRGGYPLYPNLVLQGLRDLFSKRSLIAEKWRRERNLG